VQLDLKYQWLLWQLKPHSSVVVNVGTTQAMLDTLVSANKVNKVTIATANTATDLAATDLEDGVYRV
jgi:hypothetical protein